MPTPDPAAPQKRASSLNGFVVRVLARYCAEEIEDQARRGSRKRPPGMAPAPVEPPRGPLPMQGGAAAPLEFD